MIRSQIVLVIALSIVLGPVTGGVGQLADSTAGLNVPLTAGTVPLFNVLDAAPFAPTATFDPAYHADPSSLSMVACRVVDPTVVAYVSTGEEQYGPVVPNGQLDDVTHVTDCVDLAAPVVAHLLANDVDDDDGDGALGDWDAGTINCCTPGEEQALTMASVGGPGLWVMCVKAAATTASGSVASVEDTTWFWHDRAPYPFLPSSTFVGSFDGRAPAQDCSELMGAPI